MKNKPTAIVIGAGIGGIATAARLAKNGFEVTVVEKNEKPGGRCNQIVQEGHRFDTGPTLFLMPEVWRETYAALGEKMEDHLQLKRIDPTYKVHFDDGLQLELTSNIGEMQIPAGKSGRNGLQRISFSTSPKGINITKSHWKNSSGAISTIFSNTSALTNLPLIFQLKALVKHYANVGTVFQG